MQSTVMTYCRSFPIKVGDEIIHVDNHDIVRHSKLFENLLCDNKSEEIIEIPSSEITA